MKQDDKQEVLHALGQYGSELNRLSNEKRESDEELDEALKEAGELISQMEEKLPDS